MGFPIGVRIDTMITRLLKRLPKSVKDRLIELAVRGIRWGCEHSHRFGLAVMANIPPELSRSREIREIIASEFLQGSGIEIGALHEPLKLPVGTRAVYVDKFPTDVLKSQYPELSGREFVMVDIVDDGEHLHSILNESQDFVIANHFVEHCQDPIRTIGNMVRVLREDGILYFALPDKRYTFDQDRPVTPVDHILSDYENGPEASRRDHLDDWFRLVAKIEDKEEREAAIEKALGSDSHIHYHVWTQAEMLEMVATLQRFYGIEVEMVRKNGIEVIVVLRKQSDSRCR